MAIESLSVRNVQKHRKREVEFSSEVTCLVGDSGSGKSSLLRALRWICLNKPSGDSLVRHSKDSASGELKVDGKVVKRKKGKGKNEYGLEHLGEKLVRKRQNFDGGQKDKPSPSESGIPNDVDGKGRTFKAFGTDPPKPIQEILNVGEENFQRQLDPPFWFSLTPGQVAKELNGVVDLEVIDAVLGKLAAGLRKAKAELEVGRQRYLEAKEKRKALSWVEEMDGDLRAVEGAKGAREALSGGLEALKSAMEDAGRVRREKKLLGDKIKDLDGILEEGRKLTEMEMSLSALRKTVESMRSNREERCEIEEKLKGLEERIGEFRRCPLCQNLLEKSGKTSLPTKEEKNAALPNC